MSGIYSFVIMIVFFVIAINFFMLFLRLRRTRRPRIVKAAMEEKEAAEWRDKEILRRLDHEQEEAAKAVELRNKTLALYEQVRKNAADRES